MKQYSVLVFGATEFIYGAMQENLDFFKVNIVGYIDNDSQKQRMLFHNRPVYARSELSGVEYDYILIGAWASYENIKRQLLENQVDEAKVMPLFTERIHEFMHGSVEVQEDGIDRLYRYPDKVKESLRKLNNAYESYREAEPLHDRENAWYLKSTLISHACGGYVNGCKCMYSNSKEALEYSLRAGFELIECDLWTMSEEYYLAHHAAALWEAEGAYTLITLEEALRKVRKYPNVNLLIDVKWAEDDWYLEKDENIKEYERIVAKIEDIIRAVAGDSDGAARLKNQVIMEVYNPETMEYARRRDFCCAYTQYRNKDGQNFMQVAADCIAWGVPAVAVYTSMAKDKAKELQLLKDKNLKIFCYSTDDLEEYSRLLALGADGVFTNFMTGK